ncbi:1-phosphofructokinase [Celerinatantimonas yamalensis]|uniref:Phosphofructokinase n=1 Tax=Celerinatantimonas yamalensis TaxID=559956 RepID=A0ABW9G6V5_9GAMM
MRIVSITLNPALDLTGQLNELVVDSVNLVDQADLTPGGKGINVARVLADMGTKSTVSGWLGSENQDPFVHLFSAIDAKDEFLRQEGTTRTNVKLAEVNGRVTDINFPGMAIDHQAVQRMEKKLVELAQDHEWFVLAGSLPRGVSPTLYQRWIELLNQHGAKVIFDSSGDAFSYGLEASPYLVKPNDHELAQWVGHDLPDESAIVAAARQLITKGITHVLVSRGSKGVIWVSAEQVVKAQPPKMNVVSTVGAGDSMVAAMAHALTQGWDVTKSVTYATAVSALAVTQVSVGISDQSKLESLIQQVQVCELPNT